MPTLVLLTPLKLTSTDQTVLLRTVNDGGIYILEYRMVLRGYGAAKKRTLFKTLHCTGGGICLGGRGFAITNPNTVGVFGSASLEAIKLDASATLRHDNIPKTVDIHYKVTSRWQLPANAEISLVARLDVTDNYEIPLASGFIQRLR